MNAKQTAAEFISAYNFGREPERLAIKFTIMRNTPFGFLRGSAPLYWQRVAEAGVPSGAPPAWCSCDQHLENFGSYRGDNGLVYFDLNDFDEAALAPADWDITRTLVSILIAGPILGLDKSEARDFARQCAEAYFSELASGKPRWIERKTATGAIDALMTQLKKTPPTRLLEKRTILGKRGVRKLDPESSRMLPIEDADRARLEKFTHQLGKSLGVRNYFTLMDAARRIAGTGSLGLPRFVLLIEGTGGPDGHVLIDLKAAQRSSMVSVEGIIQPPWPNEAVRIVEIQKRCEAIAPGQLRAVSYESEPWVLKELQPDADRLNLARISADRKLLGETFQTMGQLVAWAHLRAAGREGSANADQLIAYGKEHEGHGNRLAAVARDLTQTVLADYKDFCIDHDAARQNRKGSASAQ